MKVKIYNPEKYKDCPIYYRNLRDHFEYLVIINNELYSAHISVSPMLITKIFYLLGFEKNQYSYQQEAKILKALRQMAHTTIDTILFKK